LLTMLEGRAPLDWGSAKLVFERTQGTPMPRSLLHFIAFRFVYRYSKMLEVRNVAVSSRQIYGTQRWNPSLMLLWEPLCSSASIFTKSASYLDLWQIFI